jgi:hypothetical protein
MLFIFSTTVSSVLKVLVNDHKKSNRSATKRVIFIVGSWFRASYFNRYRYIQRDASVLYWFLFQDMFKSMVFYTRYVDDIFIIYDTERTSPEKIHDYINKLHPTSNLEFTPTL